MKIPTAVQQEFNRLCQKCRVLYPDFVDPELVIQTNGRTAAWARRTRVTVVYDQYAKDLQGYKYTIDLNCSYLIANAREMLEDTLPHELAHVLVWQRYNGVVNGTGSKAKPYGVE